ncbi:MAG: hypothetical protein QM796_19435 [Chthoniobacteraceae bacterium]
MKSRTCRTKRSLREPLLVFVGEVIARPVDRLLGHGIEAGELFFQMGLFVVVALHHRAAQLAHDLQALVRVRVVTDYVTEADVMGAVVLMRIRKHGLERLKVGMNIGKNGESHQGWFGEGAGDGFGGL